MSGTSSDITIECEPINVSGEIEIEKVNKISFNPFMNRTVSNKKSSDEQKSMLVGFIFLTLAIPFLLISFDKITFIIKTGSSLQNIPGGITRFAIYGCLSLVFIIIAGLGLGKVFAK